MFDIKKMKFLILFEEIYFFKLGKLCVILAKWQSSINDECLIIQNDF